MPNPSEHAAAAALARAGFMNVTFVPIAPDRRTADLVAERDGVRWAIEVRGATRPLRADATFEPLTDGLALPYPTLESYFAMLWKDKAPQLRATLSQERCAAAMLLVTVQGAPGPSWKAALKRSFEAAGAPKNLTLALCCDGVLTVISSLDIR